MKTRESRTFSAETPALSYPPSSSAQDPESRASPLEAGHRGGFSGKSDQSGESGTMSYWAPRGQSPSQQALLTRPHLPLQQLGDQMSEGFESTGDKEEIPQCPGRNRK